MTLSMHLTLRISYFSPSTWITNNRQFVCYMQEVMPDVSPECMSEYMDIVNRMFHSDDEGYAFYSKYALKKGFSVRKSYVEWDGSNNHIVLRKFVSRCEGLHEEKRMTRNMEDRQRRPRSITHVGCKAKIIIARHEVTGLWFLKDFIDEHNHPLAPPDLACLLRSHRGISDEKKEDIADMEIAGIRKHNIMDILCMQYDGYDQVGCTERDIYNYCHFNKQETIAEGDSETVIKHMTARQELDPDFFFKYLVDDFGHLHGLFWADR